MRKRPLILLLILAVMVSLTACGKTADGESDSNQSETGENTVATIDNSGIKIALLTDTMGNADGALNEAAWDGLTRAQLDYALNVEYIASDSADAYETNLESAVSNNFNLIICAGQSLAEPLRACAEKYPEQKFAMIDNDYCADLDNVTCLMFNTAQAGYLAGYVAANSTTTNTVGFILGESNIYSNEYGYGYLAGILDSKPDVTILQSNIETTSDTDACYGAASDMASQGADVLFHAAGNAGLGMFDACADSGIWAIGSDYDQSNYAWEVTLTSAVKRADTACYDMAGKAIDGTITGDTIIYDLSNDGVDYVAFVGDMDEENLGEEMMTALDGLKQQIAAGEVTVAATQGEFEAKYGDVYELD